MTAVILPKPLEKLLVIGPFYDRIDKLLVVETMLSQYDWIIFNGSMNYTDLSLEIMSRLLLTGKVIYNLSNIDLVTAKSSDILNLKESQLERWITNKSNVVIAEFPNSFRVIIVSGGLIKNITHQQLKNNLEVSFVSNCWHETYSGGLGYVISNNPLTNKPPQFYRYSAQIGNMPGENSQVYALEIGPAGIKRTISL